MAEVDSSSLTAREDRAILRAVQILERRYLAKRGPTIQSSLDAKKLVAFKLARYKREVFLAIWLDAPGHVLGIEEVSRGTITSVQIHPRELVRSAIKLNAARLIVAHNHPSGNPEPSETDKMLTRRLKDALALVDVRILDHIIVAGSATASCAERGLL